MLQQPSHKHLGTMNMPKYVMLLELENVVCCKYDVMEMSTSTKRVWFTFIWHFFSTMSKNQHSHDANVSWSTSDSVSFWFASESS